MVSPAPESNPSDIELPAPEPGDSAEVTSCLEAAAELWKSGQTKEAIRFIQRGAAAAEQDGNDMRALKLARLGADLSAAASTSSNGAAAAASTEKSAGPEKASPPLPANHPSVRVSQPPPLPAGSQSAAQATPSPPSVAPSPASTKAKGKDKDKDSAKDKDSNKESAKDSAKDKDASKDSAKDSSKDKDADSDAAASPSASSSTGPSSVRSAPSQSRAPLPTAERTSVKPSPSRSPSLAASAPPKPSPPPPTAPLSAVQDLLASGVAERVFVKRSALDANLLVVRPMAGNGAKQPSHGARHAVLIYVESDEG
jgi:hypothetical protein